MKRLHRLLASDNLEVEANRIAFERAEKLFAFIFGLIQAGIVLGLLQVGLRELESDFLALLWLFGYFATGVYILTSAKFLLAMMFKRFELSVEKRLTRWGFLGLTTFVSLLVPYFLSALTSEIVLKVLN